MESASFSYDKQICIGYSYFFDGQYLTTSGTYTKTETTSLGCDSVVTVNLSAQEYLTYEYDEHICLGNSYMFNGRRLTSSGVYKDMLSTDLVGCDSIVTLNLSVDTLIVYSLNEQICEGETYLFGERPLSEQGIYQDTVKSLMSCDSIITILNLTVESPPIERRMETIYTGQYYFLNDREYRESGIYTETLTNQTGCDSVIILYLEVIDCPKIEIPIFFTPNADGVNEKWEIKHITCYEHTVEIFDRFGRLLQRWENNFTGWDGTYLGRPMSSTDYWFRLVLNEENSYTGHFTLLR